MNEPKQVVISETALRNSCLSPTYHRSFTCAYPRNSAQLWFEMSTRSCSVTDLHPAQVLPSISAKLTPESALGSVLVEALGLMRFARLGSHPVDGALLNALDSWRHDLQDEAAEVVVYHSACFSSGILS